MITPDEVYEKAKRLYPKFVAAWLSGDTDFFPCSIAANKKVSDDYTSAGAEIQQLRRGSKEIIGHGYSVRWELRKTRRFGEQSFPVEILFDTSEDLLRYIGKTTEFRQLAQRIATIREQQPGLESWLQNHWKQLLTLDADVRDLLKVVAYICDHPRPNCFPRELPLSISTKLIETHEKLLGEWLDLLLAPESIASEYSHRQFAKRYGFREVEPHYMILLLDAELMRELSVPGCELSLPLSNLATLPLRDVQVVLVENKVNLLTFPQLQRGVALGGLGHGLDVLLDMPWLQTNQVLYWGDVDVEGLSILSRLRERYPHVRSLLMDDECLERWKPLLIRGNESTLARPIYLTEGEGKAFDQCCAMSLRLEQERIPQSEVLRACAELR